MMSSDKLGQKVVKLAALSFVRFTKMSVRRLHTAGEPEM
jgi:hypothetical protein